MSFNYASDKISEKKNTEKKRKENVTEISERECQANDQKAKVDEGKK